MGWGIINHFICTRMENLLNKCKFRSTFYQRLPSNSKITAVQEVPTKDVAQLLHASQFSVLMQNAFLTAIWSKWVKLRSALKNRTRAVSFSFHSVCTMRLQPLQNLSKVKAFGVWVDLGIFQKWREILG